jgi:serine/threonine-protein kinase
MRRARVFVLATLTVAVLASGPPARAQTAPSGNDRVAAEALFDEGRTLVAAGKIAEACPKFADSQRLDPSPSTLLNLASCWEKLGRTATAWVTYREAASASHALGRADYVAAAQRHAEALAPKLARVTVEVPHPVEGLELRRDGMVVSSVEWGQAIPVDPGTHTIQARAPGHAEWTVAAVALEGSLVTVTVPSLEALPAPAMPPAPAPAPPPAPALAPPADVPSRAQGESSLRTTGVVIGSAGIAGLVVAGTFTAFAKARYDDSLKNCEPGNPNLCNATGVNQRGDARTYGDVATVAVCVGAPALVAGAVLWLLGRTPEGNGRNATTGRAPSVGVVPLVGGGTAMVEGAW